jgi:hypothetical protein
MSFIGDLIGNLFGGGGGGGDPFRGLDPNDVEMYWKLESAIDTGERNGGDPVIKQNLAQYGLKSRSQAEHVMAAYHERHGHTPEFAQAATAVQMRVQMGAWQPPT